MSTFFKVLEKWKTTSLPSVWRRLIGAQRLLPLYPGKSLGALGELLEVALRTLSILTSLYLGLASWTTERRLSAQIRPELLGVEFLAEALYALRLLLGLDLDLSARTAETRFEQKLESFARIRTLVVDVLDERDEILDLVLGRLVLALGLGLDFAFRTAVRLARDAEEALGGRVVEGLSLELLDWCWTTRVWKL